MKIKPEHMDEIRKRINHLGTTCDLPGVRANYIASGLSEKRFRWDIMRAAGLSTLLWNTLYLYANDDHIDTALRRAIKDILKGG